MSFLCLSNPTCQRWFTFVSCLIAMVGMGSLYAYSAYAPELKKRMKYTQTETNTVSSIGDLGLYLGALPVGTFLDFFGPQLTYCLSALSNFIGYTLLYLGVSYRISHGAVVMGLYMFMAGIGNVAGYQAGLVTNVKNFPAAHRGKVTGVLASAFGLSAAIISQIHNAWFKDDIVNFLFFMTVFQATLPILPVLFARKVDLEASKSSLKLLSTDSAINTEGSALLDNDAKQKGIGKYGEITFPHILISPDFILLWIAQFFGSGAGLLFINIVGEMIRSWNVTEISSNVYVITLSIANFSGRLFFGMFTDYKPDWMPSVALLSPALLLMTIAHVLLIFVNNYLGLMIGTILTGVSYGAQFAVVPIILNRYFGDKHYGKNLGLQILSVASGGFLFGLISGKIYDAHASPTPDGELRCFGRECYFLTFILTSAFSVLSNLIILVLARREKKFDSARRFIFVEDYQ